MKKCILSILLSVLITFALTPGVIAQDSVQPKSKKAKVVLKITQDDNGKTTVVDTVFNLSDPLDHKEFEKYMKRYEIGMEKLHDELRNIEVIVDMPDFPDSLGNDSVIKHLRFIGKDIKTPHFRWHNIPDGYDYEFEVPSPPDFPPFMPECEDFEGYSEPGKAMRTFRYEKKRQTLSDILGDIPMDRVKSYSIKDKKNGKRIIIDLNDGPIIEKQEKVLILRDPGRSQGRRVPPDREMKVIIKSDDDKNMEKPE